MIINHNIGAMNAIRLLAQNQGAQQSALEKLSSGLRINKAGDDAAGLAISEKMRGQISGLDQAGRNAQDGISLIQTAEGALSETHSILQRMRELAVQSSNDTNTPADRQNIQKEVDQLSTEITRISNTTQYNSQSLLNGGVKTGAVSADTLQIGANAGQTMTIDINAMDAKSLGVSRDTKTASTTSVGGKVSSVSYDNSNLGSKVVDAATISATYTAATGGTLATTGVYTLNLPGTLANTKTITIDGQILTANTTSGSTNTATNTFASDTAANQATNLAAVINANATLSVKYTATVSGVNVTLTQKAGQETSTAPTFATTETTSVPTESTTTAGAAAVAATNATVKLTDGTNNDVISISNTAATSFTATTGGNFSGLTFNLTGAISTLNTSGTTDQVKVAVTTTVAAAATFSGGVKTNDAITNAGIDVSSTATAASNAITTIDNAISTVSAERAKLGSFQNRLDHTINNLGASSQNLSNAESRIRDVDMAKEMTEFTKTNILSQAGQAMLAQANQQPQQVLQLLR